MPVKNIFCGVDFVYCSWYVKTKQDYEHTARCTRHPHTLHVWHWPLCTNGPLTPLHVWHWPLTPQHVTCSNVCPSSSWHKVCIVSQPHVNILRQLPDPNMYISTCTNTYVHTYIRTQTALHIVLRINNNVFVQQTNRHPVTSRWSSPFSPEHYWSGGGFLAVQCQRRPPSHLCHCVPWTTTRLLAELMSPGLTVKVTDTMTVTTQT